jgi:hypothetical protein
MDTKKFLTRAVFACSICVVSAVATFAIVSPKVATKSAFNIPPSLRQSAITNGTVSIADDSVTNISLTDGSTLAFHFLVTPEGNYAWSAVARDKVAVWELHQLSSSEFGNFLRPRPKPPIPVPTPTPTPSPNPTPVVTDGTATHAIVFQDSTKRQMWQGSVELYAEENLNKGSDPVFLRYDIADFSSPECSANELLYKPIIAGKNLPVLILLDKDGKPIFIGDEPKTADAFKTLWNKFGGSL